jgi:hypothetical protein
MIEPITPEQREDLRRATLAYLAARPSVALAPDAIRAGLLRTQRLERCDICHLVDALTYLVGTGHVAELRSPLGPGRFCRATSEGVLFVEQNGVL